MSHYTLTVPDNPEALRAAAEFFAGRCGCLVEPKPERRIIGETVTTDHGEVFAFQKVHVCIPGINQSITGEREINFKTVSITDKDADFLESCTCLKPFTTDEPCSIDPAAIFRNGMSGSQPLTPEFTGGPLPPLMPIPGAPGVIPPTSTIELADGIPWDERIHSGAKTKLKSPPHGWKLKKQPDGMYASKEEWLKYVIQITEELRVAMGTSAAPNAMMDHAGTFNPGPGVTAPTPNAPVAAPLPERIPPVIIPKNDSNINSVEKPPTALVTMTYAGLTEAITRAGIIPPAVQAALVHVGLTSYPTLATQPDLIPKVAEFLGLVKP